MFGLTFFVLFSATTGLCVAYIVALSIWRLYFHPLAGFPGPRLAALTLWYECYFDVFLGGQYFKEIDRLHLRYGPIVRISPNELHVKDPDWFEELYPAGNNRRRDKYAWFLSEGTDATSSATVQHHLHRQRRATYAPSFSKRAIVDHERTLIAPTIEAMCEILDQHASQGEPVVLGTAFASVTIDVVLQIWYGASAGQPQRWSWFPEWTNPLPTMLGASHALRHFPQLFLLMSLPSSFFKNIPDVSFILNLQEASNKLAASAIQAKKLNVLQRVYGSALPTEERSPERLAAEGFSFVMAATESTAQTVASILYHLADNPPILRELRAQLDRLREECNGGLTWNDLEQLRYLVSSRIKSISGRILVRQNHSARLRSYQRHIVMEGMRVTASVTGRLARVAPDETLIYGKWTIPPGTPVSMDHHFTHLDPSIFEDPTRFDPLRWQRAANERNPLDRYLIPFGRGSRMCIGINVAKAIIYRTIAEMVQRYDMELYQTTREDIDIVRDNLMGATKAGSKGVRMILCKREGEKIN
ncbi:Trichodiene oxygenase [Penicillium rolfsii]|nr:Trichodiene oxygenase [Penicillium rolfsii]